VLNGYPATHNILIIVQNLSVPFDRRVWQEATSLKQAGFGVAVICPKSSIYTKGYEQMEGIDIYRYPSPIEANTSVIGYFLEFVFCWFATLVLAFRAYQKRPFDVIHACNPPDTYFALGLLFRPLRVKFVFDYHDLCPDLYVAKGHARRGVVYRALLLLERFTFRTADMVIAVNESYRQIAKNRGGVPDQKILVVRNGPRRDWPQLSSPNLDLKAGHQYLVVCLGQIGNQDGVDYLLHAIRLYCTDYGQDTLFAIIGGGPSQPGMQTLAAKLGVTECVRFTGQLSDAQLLSYLCTCELCVDPDPLNQFTNCSTMNKMIEYMSVGKPVIAFDLLEHRRSALGAAHYVKPNDIGQLASGMRELLRDEERRQRMSTLGKLRFQSTLAWETSEGELIRGYCQLLRTDKPLRQPSGTLGVDPERALVELL
jgi:glycosyltransferase involved in cell wall biosynthesis